MSWLQPTLGDFGLRKARGRKIFLDPQHAAASRGGIARMAAMTPEEFAAFLAKGYRRRMLPSKAEKRKKASAHANEIQWARKTEVERSEKGRELHAALVAKLGPDGMRAHRSKARKAALAKKTPDELSAWGRKMRAARTAKQLERQ